MSDPVQVMTEAFARTGSGTPESVQIVTDCTPANWGSGGKLVSRKAKGAGST